MSNNVGATSVPFASLAAMRAAHQDLLKPSAGGPLGRRRAIIEFLEAGAQSGTVLQSRADRSAGQALLDYWIGDLYLSPEWPSQEPVPEVRLAPFDAAAAPDLSDKRCPFMGLAAFLELDADRFYGRDLAIRILEEKVLQQPITLVAGPSGSGKSSLVLAGLLPKLKSGPEAGSGGWAYLPVVVPGNDPIGLLLKTVCPPEEDSRDWIAKLKPGLLSHPLQLREIVTSISKGRPAFLVVDQFEELLTLCENVEERNAYAAAVVALAGEPEGHRVVLTVREDFLADTAQLLPALKFLVANPEKQFSPQAMSARELRSVIQLPAMMVGLMFDEGIVDDLVKEVAGEPTALPLLQFTLLRLWDNRDRNRISWDTYLRVGNPREALKREADAVYQQLPQELDRQVARSIFRALVRPLVGMEFVRQRVRRETLRRLAAARTVDDVLNRFVDAGLIRMTGGEEQDDDRFEVAHEALLRNWPQLSEWLESDREKLRKRLQFRATAELSRDSDWDEGGLLSGKLLEEGKHFTDLAPVEQEFVRRSEEAVTRIQQEKESARQQELEQAKRIAVAERERAQALAQFAAAEGKRAEHERRRAKLWRGLMAMFVLTFALGGYALYSYDKFKKTEASVLKTRLVAEEKESSLKHDLQVTERSLIDKSKLAESSLLIVKDPELRKGILDRKSPELVKALKTLTDFNKVHEKESGYSENFLGVDLPVPLPKLSPAVVKSAYSEGRPLEYVHYSVVLNKARRLPVFSAANVNRGQREVTARSQAGFQFDSRIAEEFQIGEEFYRGSGLERGPLTRRSTLSWGADPQAASTSALVFTNTSPMYSPLNQHAYKRVEQWLVDSFMGEAQRISVIGGPIFRADDVSVRGHQIPRTYWKIGIARDPQGGRLVANAFVFENYTLDTSGKPVPVEYEPGIGEFGWKAYQIPIATLGDLTGLDFGLIRDADKPAVSKD